MSRSANAIPKSEIALSFFDSLQVVMESIVDIAALFKMIGVLFAFISCRIIPAHLPGSWQSHGGCSVFPQAVVDELLEERVSDAMAQIVLCTQQEDPLKQGVQESVSGEFDGMEQDVAGHRADRRRETTDEAEGEKFFRFALAKALIKNIGDSFDCSPEDARLSNSSRSRFSFLSAAVSRIAEGIPK